MENKNCFFLFIVEPCPLLHIYKFPNSVISFTGPYLYQGGYQVYGAGTEASFICRDGYIHSGATSATCISRDQWSFNGPDLPTCTGSEMIRLINFIIIIFLLLNYYKLLISLISHLKLKTSIMGKRTFFKHYWSVIL